MRFTDYFCNWYFVERAKRYAPAAERLRVIYLSSLSGGCRRSVGPVKNKQGGRLVALNHDIQLRYGGQIDASDAPRTG